MSMVPPKFFILTGDSAIAGRGVAPNRVTSASNTTLLGVGLRKCFTLKPPDMLNENWPAIDSKGQHPKRADRAPRRCRAGGGLLGGKDPAGRLSGARTYSPSPRFQPT